MGHFQTPLLRIVMAQKNANPESEVNTCLTNFYAPTETHYPSKCMLNNGTLFNDIENLASKKMHNASQYKGWSL